MPKTILITGATDGIGLETARMLAPLGHHLLLHGRNVEKLARVETELSGLSDSASIETFVADLSRISEVEILARSVAEGHARLDVLINNAGVFRTANPKTESGLDVRFVVNTIAPYVLTKRLLPLLGEAGRVVNLSSAAQARVERAALLGEIGLSDGAAYAQSKLAITMWSRELALSHDGGPVIVAVNPASMLGSKMVKEAYGVSGGDLRVGAEILVRAALTDEFADASGRYFDNDSRRFASPHPDALDRQKTEELVDLIDSILARTQQQAEA